MTLLALVVALVILVIFVAYVAKPLLAALGSPAWGMSVITGIALIIGVILIAQYFGIATPALK